MPLTKYDMTDGLKSFDVGFNLVYGTRINIKESGGNYYF
jgi:hypothetical protein